MPFEKGNQHGAKSSRALPEDIKYGRTLTRMKLEVTVTRFLTMTLKQLEAVLKDPDTVTLEMMIARIIVLAIKNGDPIRLDFLLNRVIGRILPAEQEPVLPRPVIIRRRTGETVELGIEQGKVIDVESE